MFVTLPLLTPWTQNMHDLNKAAGRSQWALPEYGNLSEPLSQNLFFKRAQGLRALGKEQPWLLLKLEFTSEQLLFYKNKWLEMGSELVSEMINAEPGPSVMNYAGALARVSPSVNKKWNGPPPSSDWRITNLQELIFIYLTVCRLCWAGAPSLFHC